MRKQHFSFAKATISSNAFDIDFEVKNLIGELNIYENITKPFLTGSVLFTDTNSFFNNINFTGTELFSVIIENIELRKTLLEKEFVMTRIAKSERVNDTTEVFVFDLIEKHAFDSASEKISKAYSGGPLGIISNVLADFTDKQLDKILLDKDPVQAEMRVIVPYMQPLQAVDWIKDRATTEAGYPYFVYASMKTQDLYVNNLANMIDTPPWNSIPFVYSQPSGASTAIAKSMHSISKITSSKVDDTLTAIESGAIGARFKVLDTLSQNENSFKTTQHSIDKTLSQPEKINAIFDTSIKVKDRRLDQLESKVYFNLISGNRYNDDINGYHDEKDLDKQITKVKNKSLRTALEKNSITIEVGGIPFLVNDNATIGSQIKVQILGRNINGNYVDKKKSGDYMILAMRHQFADTTYSVGARVTKLVNSGEVEHYERGVQ